jgi:farnesyl-diphosphate farnesyltransferase
MSDSSALLKRVSRSFYLSLRLLPGEVRRTLSLAYLLARASDSIADAGCAPMAVRVRMLQDLPGSAPRQVEALGGLPSGEIALLGKLPILLEELENSRDREEILKVWRTILSGQIFDLQRFSGEASPLSPEEAAHYTGLVAGCVGRFWTDICFKHIAGYSEERQETMSGLGFDFGCGLQWVNILRDRQADAAAGRVYVPEANFPVAMELARKCLAAGERYASLVKPRRLRAACRLPLGLGLRTLDLIEANPRAARVKVSRGFVWFSLARALWH